MKELKWWWQELESENRMIVVIATMVCASVVTLIQPAIAILAVFFVGMYFTIHGEERNEAKALDLMKAKLEAKAKK